jgi:hypothetical protein
MTTVIHGQPSGEGSSAAMAIALVLILVIGVALGIAYMNGMFDRSAPTTTIIENRTIEHHETVVVPIEVPVQSAD